MIRKRLTYAGTVVATSALLVAGVASPVAFAAAKRAPAPVVITYAAWGAPDVINAQIKQFEATHPGIIVKWDQQVTWPWDAHLAAAAAAGKMPDVFWVFDGPDDVANGWMANLNPYLKADKTWNPNNIFGNLAATGNYFGNQFMLPMHLYAEGIEINENLFKQDNVPLPKANWTLKQFEQDAIKLTKPSIHQFGLSGIRNFREKMPVMYAPKQINGFLTWTGHGYDFTNPAWSKSVDLVNKLIFQLKVDLGLYNSAFQTKWYGKNANAFMIGKVAMNYGFSWDFPGYTKLPFKYNFLPLPRVVGQRIPLVTDYMAMSRTTKHAKAAFEFLRWMTYSKSGWTWRVTHEAAPSMPLIKDPTVWQDYLKLKFVPSGMKQLLPMIPNGFLDGYKWLPGYPTVLNTIVGPNYPKFESGTEKPQDLAQNFQQRANQAYVQAEASIKAAIKSFY